MAADSAAYSADSAAADSMLLDFVPNSVEAADSAAYSADLAAADSMLPDFVPDSVEVMQCPRCGMFHCSMERQEVEKARVEHGTDGNRRG